MSLCKAEFDEAKDRKSIKVMRESFVVGKGVNRRASFAAETAHRYSTRSLSVANIPPVIDEESSNNQDDNGDEKEPNS